MNRTSRSSTPAARRRSSVLVETPPGEKWLFEGVGPTPATPVGAVTLWAITACDAEDPALQAGFDDLCLNPPRWNRTQVSSAVDRRVIARQSRRDPANSSRARVRLLPIGVETDDGGDSVDSLWVTVELCPDLWWRVVELSAGR